MAAQVAVIDRSEAADWDEALWQQPAANIYASRSWGDYKGRLGWAVRRLALCDNGEDLAYIQCQERRAGPLRRVLVQGGPVLTTRGQSRAEAVLAAFLDHLALRPADLLAVKSYRPQDPEGITALLSHGFVPVIGGKDHTIELDLTPGAEAILAAADRRWRREVKKAEGQPDLTAVFLTDRDERLRAFDTFVRMYTALQQRKGFSSDLDTAAYRDLAASDPHLLFLEIREGGEPILVRIVHTARERWTDFFTASNERARATGAASFAVWRIVERACEAGAGRFDFGGVDPAGNRGVFDFKRTLSRNVVQGGPTWIYARNTFVRRAAATALFLRRI
ncbi:GNAT family N-acetyltransferase [Methylobacterium sp. DB1607]|nr:GNAT family N-acetyltransferase [Methylobacterium sp. DB1607]